MFYNTEKYRKMAQMSIFFLDLINVSVIISDCWCWGHAERKEKPTVGNVGRFRCYVMQAQN